MTTASEIRELVDMLVAEGWDRSEALQAIRQRLGADGKRTTSTGDKWASRWREMRQDYFSQYAMNRFNPQAIRSIKATNSQWCYALWKSRVNAVAMHRTNGDRTKAIDIVERENPGLRELGLRSQQRKS